ncbi:MAG: GtrA family protein [Saccharofermentanales bacterium]|jgi:putative flippase GtrA
MTNGDTATTSPDKSKKLSQEKTRESWVQVLKFTLLSLSAAGIEAGSFFLLSLIVPSWTYAVRHVISVTLSVLWNFTLNRRYTFKSANNVPIAMLKVALFYVIFIPVTAWLGDMAARAGVLEVIVKIATMLLNFVGEFLWWKLVVFRGSENTNKLAKAQQAKKQAQAKRETM